MPKGTGNYQLINFILADPCVVEQDVNTGTDSRFSQLRLSDSPVSESLLIAPQASRRLLC